MTTTTMTRDDTGEMLTVRVIDPDQPVSAPYSRAVGILDKWVRDSRHAVDEFAAWIEGRTAQAAAEMRALCDELGLPDVQPASVQWAELPEVHEPLSVALRGRYGTIGEPSPYDPNPPAGRPVRYDKDGVQAYYDADDSDDMPGRVAHAWVNLAEDDLLPARVVRVGRTTLPPRDNPLAQAYAEREARGWTPDPADYGPRPALDGVLTVPYDITAEEAERIKQRWLRHGKRIDVEQGPRGGFWRRVDALLERWDDWLRRKQAERDKRMGAAE